MPDYLFFRVPFAFLDYSKAGWQVFLENLLIRYLLNVWRNIKATGLYFLFGVLLSALFQRYVPQDLMTAVFGGNEA